jgi:hypothetical protein
MSYPLGRYGDNAVNLSDPGLVSELADKQDKPLTGQTAPTTATVGYLGQVIFDVNGNEWKCIKISGSTYYWVLPENIFPADNTEYLAYFDGVVPVYKYKHVGTIAASTTKIGTAMSMQPFTKLRKFVDCCMEYNSTIFMPTTNALSGAAMTNGWDVRDITTAPKMFTFGYSAVYQSKPFAIQLFYSRN